MKDKDNPGPVLEALDTVLEEIILWQDFTQPFAYRDKLTLTRHPDQKFSYRLNVGGFVTVLPYKKFWRRLE